MPGKLICLSFAILLAAISAFPAQGQSTEVPASPGQAVPPNAPQSTQQTPPPAVQPATPPPPTRVLSAVVIDPAHGGADQGARGSGFTESDMVLGFARLLRISLEGQGLRVLLTRQANEGPSFDDRSKLANSLRNGVFISLHVSSTGQPGTVRVYSLPQGGALQAPVSFARGGLLPWDSAQLKFLGQSRKLAELIQIQMAQRFHGSAEVPLEAPVRQLRTVGAPAVAIEVSSVSVPDRAPIDRMGPGLADGVARAVAAFRTIYETGGN